MAPKRKISGSDCGSESEKKSTYPYCDSKKFEVKTQKNGIQTGIQSNKKTYCKLNCLINAFLNTCTGIIIMDNQGTCVMVFGLYLSTDNI
ncbi:hypothetical protein Hamer_G014635 [Homarus americanus]|uniref:Uncharacterized protein n=1 Tax=Homarus americanus TaxID=6706 RepID=A0A8J5N4I9_HOMAM|nr:hypothetical protein Hamer_G014635 [Homarus americanus]